MSFTELSQLPKKEAAIWENAHVGEDGKQRLVTHQFAGLSSTTWLTPEQFLEEVTDRLERWRDGRYEIIEVAQILADSNPEIDSVGFCKQMQKAAHDGELTVRKNGIPISKTELENGRIWSTPVRQSDVNKWLQAFNAGFELVYPYADTLPSVVPVEAVPARPLQRTAAQDSAILAAIKKAGYNPLALPMNKPGKPGIKAAIRETLNGDPLFVGANVFDKAWERLRKARDVANSD